MSEENMENQSKKLSEDKSENSDISAGEKNSPDNSGINSANENKASQNAEYIPPSGISENESADTVSDNDMPKNDDIDSGYTDAPDTGDTVPKKPPKKISVSAFVLSAIALILAAVMVTYTVCSSVYRKKLADEMKNNAAYGSYTSGTFDELEMLHSFFKVFSYYDLDDEELITAVLKAYTEATGDLYAEYYTAEEYAELTKATAGQSQGIGVTVINSQVEINSGKYQVIKIISVLPNSPALKAGVKVGDMIFYTGSGENRVAVDTQGYSAAMSALKGEKNTVAEFTVLRPKSDGTYEEISFEILREEFISESVMSRICATDPSVGIVKITEFDLTTPTQFSEAVDSLKEAGCTKFVFDVRYNGGGDLKSIVAILSYFLNEGDTIISTVTKSGDTEVIKSSAVSYTGDYAGCSVSKSDLGKYRDLKSVILCNGSTASAAELFTATFRDYDLADIVGTKTYGKGSMQSIYPLSYFGYDGAVRLTTRMYYPPCGEGYDGIGITPDDIVELSEEASKINIYELPDADDNQLQKAITHLG